MIHTDGKPTIANRPMRLYRFEVTLFECSLPYPSFESAQADCEKWAREIAEYENTYVQSTRVTEEVTDNDVERA